MQICWKVSALAFLLVLSTAEAKSVKSDGEIIIKPLREDGGDLIITPKDGGDLIITPKISFNNDGEIPMMPKSTIGDNSELAEKQFPLNAVTITNVPLALKTGVPGLFSYQYNTNYSGKRCSASAPLNTTIQLTCTIALNASSSCTAGIFQLSAGGQTLGYCGLFGTYRWTVSLNTVQILGAKCLGPSGGKFNCSILALASTSTTTGSTTTTTPTTTTTTTPTTTGTTTTGTTTTATTTPLGNSTCRCGRTNPIVRIVGGVATTVNEYPWQVGLVSPTGVTPFCGGSIISDQYIVTAAHCVYGSSPSSQRVVIGEHNTLTTTETTATKYINVQSITIHPNYNPNTQDNDIAIIKLATPITFPADNKVAPICLPPAGPTFEGVSATVTGWGTTTEGGSLSNILQEVTLPILTNSRCSQLLGTSFISTSMICAGPEAGGKDSCQGDSGGPLTTSGGTKYQVLAGIVSWGYGCARPGEPGVYTRVNNYLSFINSVIAGSKTCPPP